MKYFIIIALIGLLVLIHELGHFIAAKLMKINIAVFSIGYGPGILKWKKGATEYRISLLPLGGYVLPAVQDEKEFFKIPTFNRIIFSLGGPLASLIFPVIIISIMNIMNSGFSFSNAFVKPFVQMFNILINIIVSITMIFKSPEHLSGIVGIIAVGGKYISTGFINAVQLFIVLSLNLAVFNLIPIPALDGGKIFLYLLEKIHPKLLKIQIPAAIAGWIIILGLMVYATINDIFKIIA